MAASASPPLLDGLTFCLSGRFSVSAAELKALIQQEGGRVSSSLTASTTHLLTVTNASDSTGPSKKAQEALNQGKSVVDEDWLRDSVTKGQLLPTTPTASTAMEEEEEEEEGDGEADGAGEAAVLSPVFAGLTFVLVGPFPSHSPAEMRRLIEGDKGGGRVVASLTKAVTHVIAEVLGSKKTDEAEKRGLPIMRAEWIERCIAEGKVVTDPALEVKRASAEESEEDGEEEEEDKEDVAPPQKKRRTAAATATSTSSSFPPPTASASPSPPSPPPPSPPSPPPPVQLKRVVMKGSAPVDEFFPQSSSCHVFEDGSGTCWDCTLNQTDIGKNANKFYVTAALHYTTAPLPSSYSTHPLGPLFSAPCLSSFNCWSRTVVGSTTSGRDGGGWGREDSRDCPTPHHWRQRRRRSHSRTLPHQDTTHHRPVIQFSRFPSTSICPLLTRCAGL